MTLVGTSCNLIDEHMASYMVLRLPDMCHVLVGFNKEK